jgi:hypothetical protein
METKDTNPGELGSKDGAADLIQRPLTKGEKRVGLSFNPSKLPEVDKIKRMGADMIDFFEELGLRDRP